MLGDLIKQRRKELGLSAEDLADKVRVSPATIYRYESGDIVNMRRDKVAALAEALNLDPLVLFHRAGTLEGIRWGEGEVVQLKREKQKKSPAEAGVTSEAADLAARILMLAEADQRVVLATLDALEAKQD